MACDVLLPKIASDVEEDRIDHHAVRRTRSLQEPGRNPVAKPTRAEVHANPHAVLLVDEQIDVVVAAADGAELRVGLMLQRLRRLGRPALVRHR